MTSHRSEPSGHKRQTQGRYTKGRQDVVPGDLPAKGRPRSVLGEHVTIGHGAVPDPNPAFRGGRQVVAINLRTDVLEQEYAYKRISEGAYQAGRAYQAVLERAARAGGGQWREGDRVDQIIAHEAAVLDGIATAEMIVTMKRAARAVIGATGERVLSLVLGEGMTLRDAATRMDRYAGTDAKRAASAIAFVFRSALEDLGEEWSTVRGKTR